MSMRPVTLPAILLLLLLPSCQHAAPIGDTAKPVADAPTSRPVPTTAAWQGPRPPDWEYTRKVADAQRRGLWPPVKARRYSVYVFQNERWRLINTVDSIDTADALRRTIQVLPEDFYDLPIAVLPADDNVPPIDQNAAH